MRLVVVCILLLASIAAACSEFSSGADGARADTDAGGLAPVTGTPTGLLALTLPEGTAMLTHGTTERLKVSITRSGGFVGTVRFTLVGAPEGISANFLELEPGVKEGALEIVIAPGVPQGAIAGMKIEASNASVGLTVGALFPAFIRGRPGELDTTYADAGVQQSAMYIVVPQTHPFTGAAVFANSPGNPSIGSDRRDEDGALVVPFANDLTFALTSATYADNAIYSCKSNSVAGSTTIQLEVARFDFQTGRRDPSFSRISSTTISSPILGKPTIRGCHPFTNGRLAVAYSYETSSGFNQMLGRFDSDESYSSIPVDVRTLWTQTTDGLLAFASTSTNPNTSRLLKYSIGTAALDATFGPYGISSVTGIYDYIATDDAGRIFVSNTTSVARLSAIGVPDGSFIGATTSIADAFSGLVAVQEDGKILRSLRVGRPGSTFACALVRHLPTGALDTSFGEQGIASVPVTPCRPLGIEPLRTNQIVLRTGTNVIGNTPVQTVRIWD